MVIGNMKKQLNLFAFAIQLWSLVYCVIKKKKHSHAHKARASYIHTA